jgi:hypothetical protein
MGALHRRETILVFLIAIGPFVALAFVVVIDRHRSAPQGPDEPVDEEARVHPTP